MKNNLMSKLCRTVTSVLPINKNRTGECVNCGECCRLPSACPFLRKKNGKSHCLIYPIRSLNCRKYPRTNKEHITKETCGFKFK